MQVGGVDPMGLQQVVEEQTTAGTLLALHQAQSCLPYAGQIADAVRIAGRHDQALFPPGLFDEHHLETHERACHHGPIVLTGVGIEDVEAAAVRFPLRKAIQAVEAAVEHDRQVTF